MSDFRDKTLMEVAKDNAILDLKKALATVTAERDALQKRHEGMLAEYEATFHDRREWHNKAIGLDAELSELRARVERAKTIHQPVTGWSGVEYCGHCGYDEPADAWPCKTFAILEGNVE